MKNIHTVDAEISAKFNIGTYGIVGHQIHDSKGKVLFISNDSNDSFQNWIIAVQFGEKNINLINL
jgi:hypothetical protein